MRNGFLLPATAPSPSTGYLPPAYLDVEAGLASDSGPHDLFHSVQEYEGAHISCRTCRGTQEAKDRCPDDFKPLLSELLDMLVRDKGGMVIVMIESVPGKALRVSRAQDDDALYTVFRTDARNVLDHGDKFESILRAFGEHSYTGLWKRSNLKRLSKALGYTSLQDAPHIYALLGKPQAGAIIMGIPRGSVAAASRTIDVSIPPTHTQFNFPNHDGGCAGTQHANGLKTCQWMGINRLQGAVIVRSDAGGVHVMFPCDNDHDTLLLHILYPLTQLQEFKGTLRLRIMRFACTLWTIGTLFFEVTSRHWFLVWMVCSLASNMLDRDWLTSSGPFPETPCPDNNSMTNNNSSMSNNIMHRFTCRKVELECALKSSPTLVMPLMGYILEIKEHPIMVFQQERIFTGILDFGGKWSVFIFVFLTRGVKALLLPIWNRMVRMCGMALVKWLFGVFASAQTWAIWLFTFLYEKLALLSWYIVGLPLSFLLDRATMCVLALVRAVTDSWSSVAIAVMAVVLIGYFKFYDEMASLFRGFYIGTCWSMKTLVQAPLWLYGFIASWAGMPPVAEAESELFDSFGEQLSIAMPWAIRALSLCLFAMLVGFAIFMVVDFSSLLCHSRFVLTLVGPFLSFLVWIVLTIPVIVCAGFIMYAIFPILEMVGWNGMDMAVWDCKSIGNLENVAFTWFGGPACLLLLLWMLYLTYNQQCQDGETDAEVRGQDVGEQWTWFVLLHVCHAIFTFRTSYLLHVFANASWLCFVWDMTIWLNIALLFFVVCDTFALASHNFRMAKELSLAELVLQFILCFYMVFGPDLHDQYEQYGTARIIMSLMSACVSAGGTYVALFRH